MGGEGAGVDLGRDGKHQGFDLIASTLCVYLETLVLS